MLQSGQKSFELAQVSPREVSPPWTIRIVSPRCALGISGKSGRVRVLNASLSVVSRLGFLDLATAQLSSVQAPRPIRVQRCHRLSAKRQDAFDLIYCP